MALPLEEIWPPFALDVTAGPLRLRAIRDDDIPELVGLALAGIHDPAAMPFTQPWTQSPPDQLPAESAAYYWRTRAEFTPASWVLNLAVRLDGVAVGVQGFASRDYLVTRSGETGSWLGKAFQGRGIGTLMRQAICALLFDELGAAEIYSSAFLDNPASLAVSRKVGYADNGTFRQQRRAGELAFSRKLILDPTSFVRGPDAVAVTGADGLRKFIGLEE